MSAVYTRRLAGPLTWATGTNVTLLTVPAGKVYVIRRVTITNNDGTSTADARFGIPTSSSSTRWRRQAVPPVSSVEWDTVLPMVAGETLGGLSTPVNVNVTISGYSFDA